MEMQANFRVLTDKPSATSWRTRGHSAKYGLDYTEKLLISKTKHSFSKYLLNADTGQALFKMIRIQQ